MSIEYCTLNVNEINIDPCADDNSQLNYTSALILNSCVLLLIMALHKQKMATFLYVNN